VEQSGTEDPLSPYPSLLFPLYVRWHMISKEDPSLVVSSPSNTDEPCRWSLPTLLEWAEPLDLAFGLVDQCPEERAQLCFL